MVVIRSEGHISSGVLVFELERCPVELLGGDGLLGTKEDTGNRATRAGLDI